MHITIVPFITIGTGILIWIKAYKNSDYIPLNSALKFLTVVIQPPRLLYMLCGFPISKSYPKGVMTAWAFLFQLLGIGLLIHTFLYVLFAKNFTDMLVGLICIIVPIYGCTYWLTVKRAYTSK